MGQVRKQDDVLTELTVSGAQAGDRRAFDLLYRQWHPRLSRYAIRLTHDPEAAADVMQNSWVAIARNLRRLKDVERFKGWAYRIVSNKCRDWIRSEQARRRLEEQVEANESENETLDAVSTLRGSLKFLKEEQRTILTLFYLEEWSVKEIGSVLNLPQGTVKSRLYHARKTLKGVLEKENNE